jgi:hypothetical protein
MNPNDRASVRNAADRDQVTRAARKDRSSQALALDAVREMLRQPAGRFVMWELIERAGVFRSIWDNSARIHYNAGRQDFGHEIIALLIQADEDLYLLMETEARDRARRLDRETDAAHTARVEQGAQ